MRRMTNKKKRVLGVLIAGVALSVACTACGGQVEPAELSVAQFSATRTVTADGTPAIAYTMRVTNDSDRDVDPSELPTLTVDGIAAEQVAETLAGDEITTIASGQTVTCAGTVQVSETQNHTYELVSPTGATLTGEEVQEVSTEVAEVAEGLFEKPHEMVEGSWQTCDDSTRAYTISNVFAQATTEYDPPRLMVRGTIDNDTTNVAASSELPVLVVDGTSHPLTLYVGGRQADALAGRTEDTPSTADFEVALELDPTTAHTFAFAAPGIRLSGADEAAAIISEHLASFTKL